MASSDTIPSGNPARFPRRRYWILGLIMLALTASSGVGQDSDPAAATTSPESTVDEVLSASAGHRSGLHWIDGLIIAVYACGMLGLGWYYSRKQKNTDEYFVGNRAMNPFLIGISIFATLFSTISYLAVPGELVKHGPIILTNIFGIPITYCIVGYLMIPVYMRLRVTSAYELLEARLGLGVRMTGAAMFVLLRLLWMASMTYFTASALMVMLGIPVELRSQWLPVVTFATGLIAITYSSLGGLRAVVITDLIQFLLLFGGAWIVVGTVTVRLGGFEWFPTSWNESWDKQPLFSFDPTVRATALGAIVYGVLWWVCTAGGDQTAIQRFMATRDAKAARRSFLVNSIAGAMVSAVLALVGFSLLAYFEKFPEYLTSAGMSIKVNADDLFPRYISHHLPIGLSGLVVAGLFAAAMSSLDSGVNSITAVVTTDFIDRFRSQPMTQKGHMRFAKILAFTIGFIVVCASCVMDQVPGNFLETTQRTFGLFVTALFLLFFMALYVPFATSVGTIVGAVCAFVAALLVAYWEPLMKLLEHLGGPVSDVRTVSFQWVLPVSLAVGLPIGCLVSLLDARVRGAATARDYAMRNEGGDGD